MRASVAPMMDWTDRHCRYFHRLLSRHALLYTEMVTTGALLHGDIPRHLDFNPQEHPVALQPGGSEPSDLAQAARLGQRWGYDEINLNCGCPSERVQRGAFGACLMNEPRLVADGVRAMVDAVEVPVTVKHRTGVDKVESNGFVRDFVGRDLSRESVPEATTLLKFRRLLLDSELTQTMFDEINAHLQQQGLLMRAGTIVDATIIAAPSSTKNNTGERDPEMHQTKKGTQWHFGLKAHIAVDAESGIVHSLVSTAANVNDVTQAGALLQGQESDAFGDPGYWGVVKRKEARGPRWHIAMQPGKRRLLSDLHSRVPKDPFTASGCEAKGLIVAIELHTPDQGHFEREKFSLDQGTVSAAVAV